MSQVLWAVVGMCCKMVYASWLFFVYYCDKSPGVNTTLPVRMLLHHNTLDSPANGCNAALSIGMAGKNMHAQPFLQDSSLHTEDFELVITLSYCE